jgi:hypothetical protein
VFVIFDEFGEVLNTHTCLSAQLLLSSSTSLYALVAPSSSPAGGTQNRRAGAEQEPEVIPVPASCSVIERELLPAAKDVDDEDDPGRKAVPEPPEQVSPPHDDFLLLISLPAYPGLSPVIRNRQGVVYSGEARRERGTAPSCEVRPMRSPADLEQIRTGHLAALSTLAETLPSRVRPIAPSPRHPVASSVLRSPPQRFAAGRAWRPHRPTAP